MIKKGRNVLNPVVNRKSHWRGHSMRRECLLVDVVEGLVNGKRRRGRQSFQLIDGIKETKKLAQDRNKCRLAMTKPAS